MVEICWIHLVVFELPFPLLYWTNSGKLIIWFLISLKFGINEMIFSKVFSNEQSWHLFQRHASFPELQTEKFNKSIFETFQSFKYRFFCIAETIISTWLQFEHWAYSISNLAAIRKFLQWAFLIFRSEFLDILLCPSEINFALNISNIVFQGWVMIRARSRSRVPGTW